MDYEAYLRDRAEWKFANSRIKIAFGALRRMGRKDKRLAVVVRYAERLASDLARDLLTDGEALMP